MIDMKNYTYGWDIENRGYKEVDESRYTEYQTDMSKFIDLMSTTIKSAKCGWDSVEYKVMEHQEGKIVREYMVLYSGGHGARWIPIDGNSKGSNFSVLGENLW
jgi:hypothetical protein